MRSLRLVLAAALLLLGGLFAAAPGAFAQYHFGYSEPRHVEITGFYGGRFFGNIQLPNDPYVDHLKIDNNYDYGVIGDVDLVGPLQAEFMWSRQPTLLEAHDASTGVMSPAGNVTLDNFQWSLLYQLGDSSAKFRPYFGGGVGFTHWENAANDQLPFTNTVGFNLGGGVKYYFMNHLGARIDFRWLPTRTTSQVGYAYDYFGNAYPVNINNYAQQIQLNAGLIFRF